jgi:hypothetical protein
LAALAGLELLVGALSYRDTIAETDWVALREGLAKDDSDAIRLATGWLGPRARMEVPTLATPSAAAGPDLHGIETLTVVGLGEAWSDALDRELEGDRRPNLERTTELGPFTVAYYRFRNAPTTVTDWLQTPPTVSTPQGRCRAKRGAWACKEGNVAIAYAEVDYTPRRCFAFALDDNTPLTFTADMELGTSLRGHVGVTDFNGRLRNDAAIRVRTWVDEAATGTFTVTDTVRGTWGRKGHEPRGARKVCFELRALGGAP